MAIGIQDFGNIDSPAFGAFGAFGLKDIKIPFIQMHILLGKYADFLTAETTAVQETEHGREYQMAAFVMRINR